MIRISVNGATARANLQRKGGKITAGMTHHVRLAVAIVRREWYELLSGVPGSHPFWGRTGSKPPKLGVRSSGTRDRLGNGRVFGVGNLVIGTVGHPDQHVADMEKGGERVFSGVMGRIPTALMQTPAGVDRNAGRSIRGAIPGSFVFKSKRGALWVARRAGTRLELLYMLVRRVKIPQYATAKHAREEATPQIFSGLSLMVRQALNA